MLSIKQEKILVTLFAVFALCMALSTAYFIILCYYRGPFKDMWVVMDFIRLFFEGQAQPGDFFALHGGAHRLLVPKIFFLLEYGVFNGSNWFLILSSVGFQLVALAAVYKMLQVENDLPWHYRVFLLAMLVLFLFNATQLENFVYTFDMQWFATSAGAVVASAAWVSGLSAWRLSGKWPAGTFCLAIFASVVTVFSSFSGVCFLLVLPPLLWAYRVPRGVLVAVSVVVVVSVLLYLSGPFGQGGEFSTGEQPITVGTAIKAWFGMFLIWLRWNALYFGSPLSRELMLPAAVFAYAGLLFLAWAWWQLLAGRLSRFTRFEIFCFSAALFAAGVGMSTGLGRMYFVHTANEDRYQSIVLVFWFCLYASALSLALRHEQHKGAGPKRLVTGLILFWSCVVLPVASLRDARAHINFFDRVRTSHLAISVNQVEFRQIKSTLILGDQWQKINRPAMHNVFLQERGWGMFSGDAYPRLGQTYSVDQPVPACVGKIKQINPLASGYEIRGRGVADGERSPLTDLVVLDEAGKVVGLGRILRRKDSWGPITRQPGRRTHWRVYVQPLSAGETVTLYGVIAGSVSGLCRIDSAKLPSARG